jgi:thioredoxin-like negative regulator of GroEL
MFVETAAPAPAAFSGTLPGDVTVDASAFTLLTADNLRRTLLAEMRPAVVLCGAPWAAAWRTQLQDLTRLRRATGDRFAFYILDVLREEELAGWVQVRVLPTTLIVRNHRIVTRFAGLTPRREIQSALVAADFPRSR